jgi:HEAT repeat protein
MNPELSDDTQALLEALRSPDTPVRAAAAIQASALRDPALIPALLALLADDDATVRANAAAGLGNQRAQEALPALVECLRDPHEIVRERALTALAQLGTPEVIEPIIAMLDDPNGFVRNRAAYVLGSSRDPRAIDPLIELLDHPEASTVGVAAWALGSLGAAPAIGPLTRLLRARSAAVRGNAAWALGEMGDPALVSPLIDLLKDSDPEVRGKTAWALGTLGAATGDHRMLKPLLRLLDDFAEVRDSSAHTFVCQYAAEALTQIGTPEALAAVAAWRPRAQQALLPYRQREMIRGLAHADMGVRDEAVKALAALGDEAVPGLLDALKHRSARVRQGAARALGEMQASQAADALLVALADEDVGVWSQATAALARIAPAPLLKLALESRRHRVKLGAAIALWRIQRDEAAFPYLLIALHDSDFVVQGSAVTSLWLQPDERALAALQTLLTPQDTMMNRYVIQALQAIGTPHALGTIQHWWHETFGDTSAP